MADRDPAVNPARRLMNAVAEEQKIIAIMGDAMIDRWVSGTIMECQDGCPKFTVDWQIDAPGGAANAVASIEHWDVDVHLCTYPRSGYPTKYRFIDGEGKIISRADFGEGYDSLETSRRRTCRAARFRAVNMSEKVDGVLLSDYGKGFLTPGLVRRVVGICQRRGIPCVADCKREPKLYAGAILKGNTEWRKQYIAPFHVPNTKEIPEIYVITQGHIPPYGRYKSVAWTIGDAPPVPLVNHVGAGDCFAAHLLLALVYGFPLIEASAIAHAAGRVYVQHPYNRAPLQREVVSDMDKWKTPTKTAFVGV